MNQVGLIVHGSLNDDAEVAIPRYFLVHKLGDAGANACLLGEHDPRFPTTRILQIG